MEWQVKVDFGSGLLTGTFTLRAVGNDQALIEFSDGTNPYMIEKLTAYDKIVLNEMDPLSISFVGKNSVRNFQFLSQNALQNVWLDLHKYLNIQPISGNGRSFSICPKGRCASIVPQIFSRDTIKTPPPRVITTAIPQVISSGLIRSALSDLQLINLNENNFSKYFDPNTRESENSPIHIYEMEVDRSFAIALWQKLFQITDFETKIQEYSIIKSQWNPMDKEIWNRNSQLRKFVVELENQITSTMNHLQKCFQTIAFNVLMTYFHVQINPISFTILSLNIVKFLLKSLLVTTNKDGSFTTNSFSTIDSEHAEGIIFTLFLEFTYRYIDNESGRFLFSPFHGIYSESIEILRQRSPPTLEMLLTMKIENFDFLLPIIDIFFSVGDFGDWQMIFTAIILNRAPKKFLPCALAAAFIQLHNRLRELPIDKPDLFKDQLLQQCITIDLRLLLFNTEQLIGISLEENSAQ